MTTREQHIFSSQFEDEHYRDATFGRQFQNYH
jgi:hypothetical protein